MSAIQLLESIAKNSEIKSQILSGSLNTDLSMKLNDAISEGENQNIPMYCVLFPAEDEPQSDEDKSDEEQPKEEIKH